jgi:hypothetical protein
VHEFCDEQVEETGVAGFEQGNVPHDIIVKISRHLHEREIGRERSRERDRRRDSG